MRPLTEQYLLQMGATLPEIQYLRSIPLPADAVREMAAEITRQHPEETPEQCQARAEARLLWRYRSPRTELAAVSAELAALRRDVVRLGVLILLALAGLLIFAALGNAQVDVLRVENSSGTTVYQRAGGVAILRCLTNLTCTATANRVEISASGSVGTSFDLITTGTNTTATMTVGSGATVTFSGTGIVNASRINGVTFTNSESLGKIPIGQGDGTAAWADPLVQGLTSHDSPAATTNPVLVGGYASLTAPTNVSADGDAVAAWFLRNGAQVTQLSASGALIGGDATNGLDVDVTRVQGTVSVTGPLTDAQLRATAVAVDASGTTVPVNVQNASLAVTATNLDIRDLSSAADSVAAVQSGSWTVGVSSLPALPAGNNNIGDVDVATLPSVTIGTFPDNEPFNLAQYGGSAAGRSNPVFADVPICDENAKTAAIYSAATSGSTQLVALTSGQTIYVCGMTMTTSSSTAVTVKLVDGTGTNCATSPQDLTPAWPLAAAASTGPSGFVLPGYWGVKTRASNALCLNASAAVSVQAIVSYVKR